MQASNVLLNFTQSLVVLFYFGGMAHGQTLYDINFDNPYAPATASGAAEVGSANDYWNDITSYTTPSSPILLEDSTGSTTAGVTLTYDDFQGFSAGGVSTPSTLFQDYFYLLQGDGNIGTSTLTVSNLADNSSYDIFFYGQNNPAANGRIGAYEVNGVTDTLTSAGDTSGYSSSGANGAFSGNYVEMTGLTSANGTLTIGLGAGNYEADFAGIQIEATPEPSALSMIIGGLVFLAACLRFKRGVASI